MSLDRQQAIQYLSAEPNGCWRWAEDGGVIVWTDGTTIAFRGEIEEILRILAPNGLPPFDALVILLAACREKLPPFPFSVPPPSIPEPDVLTDKMLATLQLARSRRNAQFEACLQRMKLISTLPQELRSGLKARCNLAEAIFESVKKLPYVDGHQILRGMAEPMTDEELIIPSDRPTSLHSIQMITVGLEPHNAESLALRMKTGLNRLPKATPAEVPPAAQARQLIDELSRDNEWGVVARAAKDLMAAARLPRRLAEREDLPLGGVSDITNRGPLDRLLLSEVAHDDLTLSVRVALNEALFLRREPPMREPPGTLALLLDSGIRMWGTPRVLATALALALIARERNQSAIQACRGNGGDIEKVDLLSRATLIQHLSALATDSHVGACLPKFVKSLPAEQQSVVITHRDALDEPEFRHALEEYASVLGFVATVTREGTFELHKLPLSRRPPLCQAQLDLSAIFGGGRKTIEVKAIPVNLDWPAIFSVHPFPILLPIAGELDFWTRHDGPIYGVMKDRRLVEFGDRGLGGRVLTTNLSAGRTLWMEVADNVLHMVKAGSANRPMRLLSFTLPDGPLTVTDLLECGSAETFHRQDDVLLAIGSHHIHAFRLETGERADRHPIRHGHIHGRYFRGRKHLYVATWSGDRIQIDELQVPKPHTAADVLHAFDEPGQEGAWIVTRTGFVQSLASGTLWTLPLLAPVELKGVSRRGDRLTLSSNSMQIFVQLSPPEFYTVRPHGWDLEQTPVLPAWNIFRTLEAIASDDNGLILRGRKGRLRRIEWVRGAREFIQLRDYEGPSSDEILFSLKTMAPGCALSVAAWPDGRKAYMDNRGLLHLRPSAAGAPELTLVLSQGEVAGWTSDGMYCGPSFFFGGPGTYNAKAVFDRLRRFIHDSLP